MTRLFLRFYLGVVAILISAWMIQSYVFRQRGERENIRVVEQALAGGARLARDELARANPDQVELTFRSIQERFDYPVNPFRLDAEWLGEQQRQRLIDGDVVWLGEYIAIAMPAESSSVDAISGTVSGDVSDAVSGAITGAGEGVNRDGLVFGPLPQFVGPSQAEITFGYGVVFLLAAIAIAILLRPVVSQLRAVERTASAIAKGDLSARIDSSQAAKDLTLVRAFNTMAERTETSLRTQRELLQAVSHELRTPLARIRFAADLVDSAKTDDERRIRLDAIDDATQKLDDLVGELLTYARLDSDVAQPEPEDIDLSELFAELMEIHAPLHPSVDFVVDSDGDPVCIHADRASLSRAIENLLSNAGRFARKRVTIRATKTPLETVIEVEDDGEGIPEVERERIFEPFIRIGDAGSRGVGLGLALVQRIARRHGGKVVAGESKSGGAAFSLHLPAKR